jgi:hypothetical protein
LFRNTTEIISLVCRKPYAMMPNEWWSIFRTGMQNQLGGTLKEYIW